MTEQAPQKPPLGARLGVDYRVTHEKLASLAKGNVVVLYEYDGFVTPSNPDAGYPDAGKFPVEFEQTFGEGVERTGVLTMTSVWDEPLPNSKTYTVQGCYHTDRIQDLLIRELKLANGDVIHAGFLLGIVEPSPGRTRARHTVWAIDPTDSIAFNEWLIENFEPEPTREELQARFHANQAYDATPEAQEELRLTQELGVRLRAEIEQAAIREKIENDLVAKGIITPQEAYVATLDQLRVLHGS